MRIIMRSIIRNYPIGALALLLLACVRFEYQTETWSVGSAGLAAGVVVLAIIAMVLVFRIFNAVQEFCIARRLLKARIRSKYDLLVPVGILAVLFQWRGLGEPFQGAGKSGHRWEVVWSDPAWMFPFIGALAGVVLLLRVFLLFRALAQEANENRWREGGFE